MRRVPLCDSRFLLSVAVFFCASFTSHALVPSPTNCYLTLTGRVVERKDSPNEEHTQLTIDKINDHYEIESHRIVEDLKKLPLKKGRVPRDDAKRELTVKRALDELHNDLGDPTVIKRLSMEQLIGKISALFERPHYRLNEIFRNYNIKNIRFTKSKKFKVRHELKDGKYEMFMDVPDVDFSDRVATGKWLIKFFGAVQSGVLKQISLKMDAANFRDAWKMFYKSEDGGPSLKEQRNNIILNTAKLQFDIVSQLMRSGLSFKDLHLGLHARALWPTPVKYAGEGALATSGYVSAGGAEMLVGFIKSSNPHAGFVSSEHLIMGGEEGRNAELSRLDHQTNIWFVKKGKTISERIIKTTIGSGLAGFAGYAAITQTGVGNAMTNKLQDLKDHTGGLDDVHNAVTKENGVDEMIVRLRELVARRKKAHSFLMAEQKKKHPSEWLKGTLTGQIEKLTTQIEDLAVDIANRSPGGLTDLDPETDLEL